MMYTLDSVFIGTVMQFVNFRKEDYHDLKYFLNIPCIFLLDAAPKRIEIALN